MEEGVILDSMFNNNGESCFTMEDAIPASLDSIFADSSNLSQPQNELFAATEFDGIFLDDSSPSSFSSDFSHASDVSSFSDFSPMSGDTSSESNPQSPVETTATTLSESVNTVTRGSHQCISGPFGLTSKDMQRLTQISNPFSTSSAGPSPFQTQTELRQKLMTPKIEDIGMQDDGNVSSSGQKRKRKSSSTRSNLPESLDGLPEDEKERIKKQRRMHRNRESAHLSRQRKKMYIDQLEQKVRELELENQRLRTQNDVVQKELVYWKDRCGELYRKAIGLDEARIPGGSNARVASVFACVILLSFGILFTIGDSGMSGGPLMIGSTASLALPSGLEVQPHTGRNLQSLTKESAATGTTPESSNVVTGYSSSKRLAVKDSDTIGQLAPYSGGMDESRHEHERTGQNTSLPVIMPPHNLSDGGIDWQPDTSYLYCATGEVVHNPMKSGAHVDYLSLLIPSSLLNLSEALDMDMLSAGRDSLVEINCNINYVNVYPILDVEESVSTTSVARSTVAK